MDLFFEKNTNKTFEVLHNEIQLSKNYCVIFWYNLKDQIKKPLSFIPRVKLS